MQARYREARDRLSVSEYRVGYFYFRQRWYPGAIARFKALLKEDPSFTQRDALYYYLGESLLKVKLNAEALPYFDRLVKEFETSEFLEPAKLRLDEFKETVPPDAPAATGDAAATPQTPAPGAAAPAPATPAPAPGSTIPTIAPAPTASPTPAAPGGTTPPPAPPDARSR